MTLRQKIWNLGVAVRRLRLRLMSNLMSPGVDFYELRKLLRLKVGGGRAMAAIDSLMKTEGDLGILLGDVNATVGHARRIALGCVLSARNAQTLVKGSLEPGYVIEAATAIVSPPMENRPNDDDHHDDDDGDHPSRGVA